MKMKQKMSMRGGVNSKSKSADDKSKSVDHNDDDAGVIMHGSGKCNYSDGSVYEGEFINDMKHGTGVLQWPKDIIDATDRSDSSSRMKRSSKSSNFFNIFKGRFINDQMAKGAAQPFFEIDANLNDSVRGIAAFKD